MVAMAALVYAGMSFYFTLANKRRLRGDEDSKAEGLSEADIAELGDRSPRFIYTT